MNFYQKMRNKKNNIELQLVEQAKKEKDEYERVVKR